jgi:chitodextrinase
VEVERMRGARAAVPTVLALALLCLALAAFAPTAAAQESGTYSFEQGDQCIDVDPIVDENQTVEEFYDYRNPYTTPQGDSYSSYGTVPYQEDNTSILMIYEGAEGTSLVVVHEKYHEDDSGTNGSSVTFTVTGISPGDGWAVEDDNYNGQDDEFYHNDSYSEMNWVYADSRTDGGAYRGLGDDFEVDIQPQFNEDANKRFDGSYGGQIHDWKVVTATDDGFERVPFNSLEQNVTITPGHCEAAPPTANLTVDDTNPEVGVTNVTLDASGSDAEAGISEYRWDLTGDGSADRVTGEPVIDHVFEETGERDVTVTVVDEYGQTDSESVTVTVEDTTAPTARLDAPAEGTTGETLGFSGAESDDNHRIHSYEWSFGDGANAAGETVDYSYDEAGTYEVRLRVTDESGNEDTTTATVEISEPGGPTAVLDAPDSTTTGESVTLDASDSETGENTTYGWYVDGGHVATTADPTYQTAFSEAGTHDVRVEVTDENGTDSASTAIDVDDGLTARIEASVTTVETGEEIPFDGTNSSGDIVYYYWEFGDGTRAGNGTVTHAYDEPGEYEVELVVEDSESRTASDNVTVSVQEPADDVDEDDDGDSGGTTGGGSGWTGGGGDWSGSGSSDNDGPLSSDESSDEPDVEVEGDVAVVTAADVDAGDPVAVDIPSDSDGFQPVVLESVELRTVEDVEDLTVELESDERAVPGRFADTTTAVPSATADLESVTYEFSVDRELLRAAGVTEENLTAYASDSEWEAIETETESDGDRINVTATVEGDAPVAVGAEGPVLYVTDLRTDGAVRNSTVDVEATVRNTGTEAGERNLTLTAGETVTEVPVRLNASEERTVETNVTVPADGAVDVRAGAIRHDLAVIAADELAVRPAKIEPGETVTVEATIRNRGTASDEREVRLVLADRAVETQRVSVEPGEYAQVTFEQRVQSPGNYEVSVGDARGTVRAEGDADGNAPIATEDGAGFGALTALAAVVAGLLALRRRTD